MDDYAKDSRPERSELDFNHNPLRHLLFYLVGYEAQIHKSSLNGFSELVYLISKPYGLK